MDRFCSQDQAGCPHTIVCHCLAVSEAEVVEAIETHELRTIKEVRCHTGAGDGCMCCHSLLRAYLARQQSLATAV